MIRIGAIRKSEHERRQHRKSASGEALSERFGTVAHHGSRS